jgi:hypothetical protein
MISKLQKSKPIVETAGKKSCRLPFRIAGRTINFKLWRAQMKYLLLSLIIFLWISWLLPAYALQGDEKSAEDTLNNVDAIQAMAIANQWKWTKKEVKSYVTPRGVIFIFPDRKVKGIPLPEDKMIVAVAPYIRRTHR